jgi:hypothetical protein
MLDTDLSGLGPKEAYDYVLAFLTTLKQTEKARAAADEELALWGRRVELATAKGDAALATAAQARVAELSAKRAGIEAELTELKTTTGILKDELKRRIATGWGGKLVDTDLLLAQLEMVVGPKDELSQAMKHEEASAALDELKRKMGGQPAAAGDPPKPPEPDPGSRKE